MAELDRHRSNPENNSLLRCVIHQEAEGQLGPESAPFLEHSQRMLIYTVVMDLVTAWRSEKIPAESGSADTVNSRGRL